MSNRKLHIKYLIEAIQSTLYYVKRDGMDVLVDELFKTDYPIAPASVNYHLNVKHGLLVHHWNVFKNFFEKNKKFRLDVPIESVIVCGLLHDLCKVYVYIHGEGGYTYNEKQKEGHAVLSIERIERWIKLTDREKKIIKYHMGLFGIDKGEYTKDDLHNAIKNDACVQIFASSDMEATCFESAMMKEVDSRNSDIDLALFYQDIDEYKINGTPLSRALKRVSFIEAVKELDKGDGVLITELEKFFRVEKSEQFEKIMEMCIKGGDVFRVAQDKLKYLN